MSILDKLGIDHVSQYSLGRYFYDEYLPDHNILIEYDGWHWHYSDWAVKRGMQERDRIKDELAEISGFGLIRLAAYESHDLTYEELYSEIQAALFL